MKENFPSKKYEWDSWYFFIVNWLEYLSNVNNGKGLILGGITGISPTDVVIIGAGTVGEYAL